jgi:hypothetical protein
MFACAISWYFLSISNSFSSSQREGLQEGGLKRWRGIRRGLDEDSSMLIRWVLWQGFRGGRIGMLSSTGWIFFAPSSLDCFSRTLSPSIHRILFDHPPPSLVSFTTSLVTLCPWTPWSVDTVYWLPIWSIGWWQWSSSSRRIPKIEVICVKEKDREQQTWMNLELLYSSVLYTTS